MQVLFGNSHARAHERAYQAAQDAAEEQKAYEAFIATECADVLKRQAAYTSLIETAIDCVRSEYWDSTGAANLAFFAGNLKLAEQHLEAARPFLEREIKSLLVLKTPIHKWRREHRELSYEH